MAPKPRPAGGKRELAKKALQLRISLLEVEPEIWRRFVVPADIPLARLHDVLQAVMGWLDCHLHLFRFRSGNFGVPDPDFEDDTQDELKKQLHQLVEVGDEFVYAYDFGDDWHHRVVVEAVVERKAHRELPICLEGARRCPPEDVGGAWGYSDFLEAYLDPKSERHSELVEWIGEKFDPERFDLARINTNLQRIKAGRHPLLPEDDARWSEEDMEDLDGDDASQWILPG